MLTKEEMLKVIEEEDRTCDCCIYEINCPKGVSGSPNGVIFPPCIDGEIYDEELIKEVYQEIIEQKERRIC